MVVTRRLADVHTDRAIERRGARDVRSDDPDRVQPPWHDVSLLPSDRRTNVPRPMTVTSDVIPDNTIRVLDHGFVRLDGCMADDLSVVNGARVSFAKRRDEMTDA